MIEKVINGIKIHEWKYQNTNRDDTGYNDLNKNVLSKYNCQDFALLSEEEKKAQIDEIFKLIRERNIYFKVYYYTHKDIIEEIQYCKEKEIPIFDGERLDKRPTLGNNLLNFCSQIFI